MKFGITNIASEIHNETRKMPVKFFYGFQRSEALNMFEKFKKIHLLTGRNQTLYYKHSILKMHLFLIVEMQNLFYSDYK